jgi:predicted DNA-binding WGR domain protein
MKTREFEYKSRGSNKFWQIEVHGPCLTVHFGRIGSKGQAKTKEFDSPEAAARACDDLIAQKMKKGYVERPSVTAENELEDIYLVSEKIFPIAEADIRKLERAIGSLPNGYRAFIHRCGGVGQLFDHINVWPPQAILDAVHRERENMTFSDSVPWVKDLKGLDEADFREIWVFATDSNGNNYCYFPRHRGTLFNIVHGGMEVVRHDPGFLKPSLLWCSGRVRHPFPYFTPIDLSVRWHRSLHSFNFQTFLRQKEVAQMIADYWKNQGMDVVLVELPAQHEGGEPGDMMVFVKSLGAAITVSRDDHNDPGKVFGNFESDKEQHFVARRCLKALTKDIPLS